MAINSIIQQLRHRISTNRLRFKLTMLVMSTTITVLVAAGVFIGMLATDVIEDNSKEQLKAMNITLSLTSSAWLESPLNAMKNLAAQPDIRSMVTAQQRPLLQIMASAYPYMYLISTTDMRGVNVARSDNEEPKNYSDRNWFKKAASGKDIVYESVIARTIGAPALIVSVPVRDNRQKIVGVSMFATELTHLTHRVHAVKVGKTGISYIVDQDNRAIAHPDPAYTSSLRDLGDSPPVKALRQGQRGHVSFVDDQGKLWRAYLSVLDNGWGVIVQQQESELLGVQRMFVSVAFAAVLASVLLAAICTWFIVRNALKPVKQLSEAVSGITVSSGEMLNLEPARIVAGRLQSDDEVGTLSSSFCSMASMLQSTIDSLNRELDNHRITAISLSASEEKYRSLVDSLSLGVYQNTFEPQGHFIQANPAMLKIFGYDSQDEFMSISVSDLYQNAEDRIRFIEEVGLAGTVTDKELAMRRKDGTPIWVSASSALQKDKTGSNYIICGIVEDITEKKRLESQLLQAQKMEAIGTFAGGIAHDFNNILTAIIGYASMLKLKMQEQETLQHYVEDILASSDKATKLTQSLLAFSRKQTIKPTCQNLNDIVSRVEKFLHRIIGEDIDFRMELAKEALTIMADSGQLEQVLLNLATNGRDAMPNGGMLSIKTERADITSSSGYLPPGPYAVLSVSDTGSGMDEQTRQRIFEPFYTTKESGKGTGLGLSIVYGIIKQHNGEINVYSEPGNGTTFRIYFRLESAKQTETQEACHEELHKGTETILLAEDNADVRLLMKNILEDFGYNVIEAVDGQDALEKFKASRLAIDMLIMDVVMPRKNGKEAYDLIRQDNQHIPVLFASGYTADIIHQKGILEEGMCFISKPVTPFMLLKKVREILDQAAASARHPGHI